jgi:hypothetical protein
MANDIKVNVLTGLNDKGIKDGIAALKGLGAGIGNLTKQLVGGYIGFQGFQKGVEFIRGSIDASRDLQRNLAGLNTIFGESTDQMRAFAEAGVSMGMSTAEAAKATTFIGSVMKQSGFAMEENIYYTKQLVSLGADLAATYGYDVQEALTGMTALFRGEYDPIEKFGVAIKQAQVNTLLAEQGMGKLTGTQKLQSQQLARMILLFRATGDVQGAFSRQTNTLAVAQQQLAATFTNLQASLGNSLIGPMTGLVRLMQELTGTLAPSLEKLFAAIAGLFGIAGDNAAGAASQISGLLDQITILVQMATPLIQFFVSILSTMGGNIIAAVLGFKALRGIISGSITAFAAVRAILVGLAASAAVATTATTALAGAQTGLAAASVSAGRAFMATPWGLLITGIVGAGAGLFVLGSAFVDVMNKAKPAAESVAEFHSQIDETGNVSGYGTALFNITNGFNQVTSSASKAIAATTVFENITKRDNSDIFTRTMANNKKTYKPVKSSALTQAEKDLAAFKKLMKEMGLLGGDATSKAGSAAAKKAAQAITTPFKDMVGRIQGELAKLKDAIVGAFDITSMGTSGGSISRNIDKFMVKLRQFAGYIAQLRAGGLNEGLLTQLAMAGPDGGLAAAKAFAGSPALVAQANAAYGELGMTANAIAGNVVGAQAAPVYNITVSGGVGSGATIGKAVVTAIQAYERQSGPSWRTK